MLGLTTFIGFVAKWSNDVKKDNEENKKHCDEQNKILTSAVEKLKEDLENANDKASSASKLVTDKLREDYTDLKIVVVSQYVHKDELNTIVDKISGKLDVILEKLNAKADRDFIERRNVQNN